MQTDERAKLIKVIALLRLAILKWQRMTDDDANVDDTVDDCALCAEYYKVGTNRDNYCSNCPIKADTAKQFCDGTPYQAWSECEYEDEDEAYKFAANMVKYLQRLLKEHTIQLESTNYVPLSVSPSTTTVHV
jgi:hypothetical protein